MVDRVVNYDNIHIHEINWDPDQYFKEPLSGLDISALP